MDALNLESIGHEACHHGTHSPVELVVHVLGAGSYLVAGVDPGIDGRSSSGEQIPIMPDHNN